MYHSPIRTRSGRSSLSVALSTAFAAVIALTFLTLTHTQVQAQPTPTARATTTQVPQLATIVVTPSRTAEPLSKTLGDNSVITRETLDTLPNGTLSEALVREHSIEGVNLGGPQTVSTINIRGYQ